MKTLTIDFADFKNIDDVYAYLDANIYLLESNHDVVQLWVGYRDHTTDQIEKKYAQWELECFMFNIVGSEVLAFSYSTGEKPEEFYQYPTLDETQKAAFDYVKKRAKNTVSPALKARYNHLLWKGVKGVKNRKYAIEALDNSIVALKEYLELFKKGDDEKSIQLNRRAENLASLANDIKMKIPETVQLFRLMLFDIYNIKFYTKYSLLDVMLEHPSVFPKEAFEDTLQLFERGLTVTSSERTDDFMFAKSYLQTAIKIASKTGADLRPVYERIGECYERLGDIETEQERFWIKQQQYALAIRNFRMAGNMKKRNELEIKYADLKDEVTLPTTVIDYSPDHIAHLEKVEEEIEEKADKLLKQGPDAVYEFITMGTFFPTKKFVTEHSRENIEPWLRGISTVTFDINKNIESISDEDDDTQVEAEMDTYKYQVKHYASRYLYHILIPGIRSGKLTYQNLISYLTTNTWLGSTFTKKDLGGQQINYNWVSMVAPSIVEYFIQMRASLSSQEFKPNFILCIDSLTIKFEGLFREFCTRIKTPTSTNKKSGMQEMYIHQLLTHPTIIEKFNEDDRLLFEFLFTREKGLNLRNNIAHCYYDYNDYSYSYFNLLLAALLRLGKYKFKKAS